MTEDMVTVSTESETDSAVKASQFYSATAGHNSTSGQVVSRKKKKRDKEKTESRKKVGTDKSGKQRTMRSSSTSSKEKRENTPHPVEDHIETEPSSVSSHPTPTLTSAQHTTSRGHSSTGTLKSELFGDFDSDTDCVILSSPCSSGEEEIMNISFEDALRGVEVRRGRGRRVPGKSTVGVPLRGRGGERGGKKVVMGERKGREMVKGKIGGEGRGKSDQTSRTRRSSVSKKSRQRQVSNEGTVLESNSDDVVFKPDPQSLANPSTIAKSNWPAQSTTPRRQSSSSNSDDFLFKPDPQSLVNLSAAAKSNRSKQSTIPRRQSSSSSQSAVTGSQGPRSTPSSTPAVPRPSYSIFKKKEVTLTGTSVTCFTHDSHVICM